MRLLEFSPASGRRTAAWDALGVAGGGPAPVAAGGLGAGAGAATRTTGLLAAPGSAVRAMAGGAKRPQEQGDLATRIKTRTERKIKRPRMYRVLLHNDDYTPREFVVLVLQTVFHLDEAHATRLMLYVHNHGVGVVGLYPYSVAETKCAEVAAVSEKANFPLMCSIEPDEEGDTGGEAN